jgi:hypothetical protein
LDGRKPCQFPAENLPNGFGFAFDLENLAGPHAHPQHLIFKGRKLDLGYVNVNIVQQHILPFLERAGVP